MTVRRPLVRSAGRTRQLPSGDALAGVPVYIQATQQAGTILKLAVDATNYTLVATQQSGTALAIGVAISG